MADESLFLPADALKLVKAEACDYFNIKLMKSGGITNSLKISHVAESANIRCMVGCMLESRVALTAAAHLAAAAISFSPTSTGIPNIRWIRSSAASASRGEPSPCRRSRAWGLTSTRLFSKKWAGFSVGR